MTESIRFEKKIYSHGLNVLAKNKRFSAKLASSEEELEEIYKIRYRVFQSEFQHASVPEGRSDIDMDVFDNQFHHLMLTDNATGQAIGTYRFQTHEDAEKGLGFYSQSEFDVMSLGDEIIHGAVEVGRACVLPEYRNSGSLLVLWKGLAKLMTITGKRYFFGCCSINGTSPETALRFLNHLRDNDYLHKTLSVDVQEACRIPLPATLPPQEAAVTLPKLFAIYLKHTGKICGGPALDKQMEAIDFLMLLDINNMSEFSRRIFFGE